MKILGGIAHAPRRGMIHRDLKPENVLVTIDDEGRECAKLVDFGIVKLSDGDTGVEPLTRVGLVFGTPRYMSPEQVSGGKVSERTDLYALGVMLFEMLTGNAPFDADDAGMVMRMQVLGDVPEMPATVPAPIADVVRRLLEKSPADRPASAKEVREALETAMLAAPGRTVVAPSSTDPYGATIGPAAAIGTAPTLGAPAAIGTAPTVARSASAAPPPPPPLAPAPPPPAPPSSVAPVVLAPASAQLPTASRTSVGPRAVIVAAIVLLLVGVTALFFARRGDEPPSSGTTRDAAPAGGLVAPPTASLPAAEVAGAPAKAAPPSAAASDDDDDEPRASDRPRARPAEKPRRHEGKGHGKGHDKKKKVKWSKGGMVFEID
jgi:hypothetical protein